MAPRTTYANLTDGLQNFSLFDQSLADMGLLGTIPCAASGTNAIALTPLATAFAPTIPAYSNYLTFKFVASASSTGSVTINISGLGALNAYESDGVTALGSGSIVSGAVYTATYGSALNSNAGGFYVEHGGVGATFPGTAASITWTGNHTFNPVSGNAITINTASGSTGKGFSVSQTGPSTGTTAGNLPYNIISISDGANVTGDTRTWGLLVSHSILANASGQKYGIGVELSRSVTVTQNGDLVGIVPRAIASAPNSGSGGVFGANPQAIKLSGANDLNEIAGIEADVRIDSGAAANWRFGVAAVSTGAVQGSSLDAAYEIRNVVSGGEFLNGILLHSQSGINPIATTGAVIGSDGSSVTIANVISLPTYTVTGNIFNFANFSVTGAGLLTATREVINNQTATSGISVVSVNQDWSSSGPTNLMSTFTAYGDVARFVVRRADGSQGSPSGILAGETIGTFSFRGYTSAGAFSAANSAQMAAVAINNWSNTDTSTFLSLITTPSGSTAQAEVVRVQGSGGMSVGNANITTDPGAGGILATLINTTGAITIQNGTAIPAGGTAGAGYKLSSTSNFGVFFGSGAPTLSAAQGSVYLRSDGSSTSTRLYVNTNGTTGWTNFTSAT